MDTQKQKRSAFSGKIGFVLSAAGASVGLGNIWRFPYLAAKYGGGIFLLVYIVLAVTFGYTMIVAETALGRMTHKSPVGAFGAFGKKGGLRFGGWINAVIPILIVPYYSVIGGWVIRYLSEYISGHGSELSQDGYFSNFISSGLSAEVCFLIFTAFTLAIIFAGVRNGVERVSKVMMPVLVVLSVVIAGYSVTLHAVAHTGKDNAQREQAEQQKGQFCLQAVGDKGGEVAVCCQITAAAAQILGQIVDDPAADDRVIRHDQDRNNCIDPPAEPQPAGCSERLERTDRAFARHAAQRRLGDDHGIAERHGQQDIDQQEDPAAVFRGQIREAPDVPKANGRARR